MSILPYKNCSPHFKRSPFTQKSFKYFYKIY